MKHLLFFLVVAFVLFQACDDTDPCVEGNRQVNSYELQLGEFTKIDVSSAIDLRITQSDTTMVIVEAETNIFPLMEYENNNGTFELHFRNNTCIDNNRDIIVHVTLPDLEEIELSGSGEILSVGDLDLDHLTVDISGSADIQLTGNIQSMAYLCSGSIDVANFGLDTEHTAINISGSANMEILCANTLDINVSGSANIKYKGNPNISQNVSGSLQLTDAN